MKVDTANLLTVQNFAIQFGLKSRNSPFTRSYIYKLVKEKKIDSDKYVVEIDGVTFVRKKALTHVKL